MQPVPDEAELAAGMGKFARVLMNASARAGEPIGLDTASPLRLDDLCAMYLAITPDEESIQRMTRVIGAYLGELIVHNGGGKWIWDTRAAAPGVQTPHGHRCFPLAKVHKRLIGAATAATLAWRGCGVLCTVLPLEDAIDPTPAGLPTRSARQLLTAGT